MSTNFFAFYESDQGRDEAMVDRLHIGKSAVGWPFTFRAHVWLGVSDWPTWKRYLSRPGILIENEYGNLVSVKDLEDRVAGARAHWESGRVREVLGGDLSMTLDGDLSTRREFS